MNAERILVASDSLGDAPLVHREGGRLRGPAGDLRQADRRQPGRAVPDRQGPHRIEAADLMRTKAAKLFDAGMPCGAEANMAKYLASEAAIGGGQRLHRRPRRLRLRGGVRRRAQVPRVAPLQDGADQQQPGPGLRRRARPRHAPVLLGNARSDPRGRARPARAAAGGVLPRLRAVVRRHGGHALPALPLPVHPEGGRRSGSRTWARTRTRSSGPSWSSTTTA